ncbi:MAG: M28 family peptidase [Chitinophagaceae bacterium]|nr:M28 family peptidase [Chitinophagaceae bacterium]
MLRISILFLLITQLSFGQKQKKANKIIISNLQTHVNFLADDKLEGRRTGTNGEKLAYEYISNEFKKNGLIAKGDNETYIQAFEVNEGKQINKSTHFIIDGNDLKTETDFTPFIFSANKSFEAASSIALPQRDGVWFWNLKDVLEENKTNPHFDLQEAIKTKVKEVTDKGAAGLILFNTSAIADEIKFEAKAKTETAAIPVIYVYKAAAEKYLKDEAATHDIKLKVDIGEKKRTGHNVVGYMDNGANSTIVLGAHYDHLGYGEDKNSLYAGSTPQIHNGADDNASGTAAMLELSKMIKASKLKKYNYLFIAFSGEELGLYGSKHYTEHPTINLSNINYMINLDMVGRLNDSTHGLSIGGYGTSPKWGELLNAKDNFFTIKFDSSGTGPSDHTSFYRKDIPVLFFFTGTHGDYHKPSDDANKINFEGELQIVKYIYNIVDATNKTERLAFTKTREAAATSKNTFKVSLGIMPDYTFSGSGVKVDGVSEGKLAQKIGIVAGDVVEQLGDFKFTDVQSYMQALGKFKKGEATKVKVKRGDKELWFDIVF